MISCVSLKMGHDRSKTRSPGHNSQKSYIHLEAYHVQESSVIYKCTIKRLYDFYNIQVLKSLSLTKRISDYHVKNILEEHLLFCYLQKFHSHHGRRQESCFGDWWNRTGG